MAEVLQRLGATEVVADTNTSLGSPDVRTTWVVSTIVAVNMGSTARSIRIAHIDGAIGDIANEDYICYDYPIEPNGVVPFSLGICVSAEETILVRASHAEVHFIAWGSVIS